MLRRKGIVMEDIGYLLITHYHPDHAGLAQEVKAKGVRLIVLHQQLPAIPLLKGYMKPVNPYVNITLHDNLQITIGESRAFLKRIGIAGEIVWTPGHSDDSVSLVMDEGVAFTGDLPPPGFVEESASATVRQSWDALRALGVRQIYPGHGPVRPLPPAFEPSA
jgi:glyoxylase-like metal-dependent hydrolase (beta-lactamase superfamily II)